ncbi:hypothetical protein [Pseudarthrobacter sp. 1C304]
MALQPPDVRVISLGSAAPLRRVLLAQRQGRGLLIATAVRLA